MEAWWQREGGSPRAWHWKMSGREPPALEEDGSDGRVGEMKASAQPPNSISVRGVSYTVR